LPAISSGRIQLLPWSSRHAWDLLRAARLEEALDPHVVADLMKVVEPHLEEMLAYGAYGAGPSHTLPPDASSQSRLLDWFGRRP
jgi:hypothetical protein